MKSQNKENYQINHNQIENNPNNKLKTSLSKIPKYKKNYKSDITKSTID